MPLLPRALLLLALAAPTATAAAEPASLELRGSVEAIVYGQGTIPADPKLVPDLVGALDVRPNFRFELGKLAVLVRPRILAGALETPDGVTHYDFTGEWLELYGQWTASENLTLALGIQNFQWGPAELLSPSNRLIHYTGFDATILTVVHAPMLFRANLSWGEHLSAVLLVDLAETPRLGREAIPTIDPTVWNAGDPFDPKTEVKLEVADGANYLGLTAGVGEVWRPWAGGYGQWQATDALALYADGVVQLGSRAWYPTPRGFVRALVDAGVLSEILVGARLTLGRADVRLEYMHDQAAWNQDDLAQANAFIRGRLLTPDLLGPYLAPGLDVPGQDLAYLSARLSDLGRGKRLALHGRYLLDLHDRSGAVFASAEYTANDAVLLYAVAGVTHGDAGQDLTRLARASLLAAAKVTW